MGPSDDRDEWLFVSELVLGGELVCLFVSELVLGGELVCLFVSLVG